jgi:cell wall-associated NlpC family hydrolase
MSALGMRSPKLTDAGRRARIATVAALCVVGGLFGLLQPAPGVASTRRVHKLAARGRTRKPAPRAGRLHARPRPAQRTSRLHSRRFARRRRALRPAKRSPLPPHFAVPQGDGSPVVSAAVQLLGRPYRFGADRGAFDCSGLVRRVFAEVGIDLPHSARAQFALGDHVSRDDLEPGDLVFFHSSHRYATHVGIYLGDDMFVHAAAHSGRVRVDSLDEAYFARRYLGARRLDI